MQIELSNNWFALLLVNESLDEELFDTSFEAKQQLSKKGSIVYYDIIWLEVTLYPEYYFFDPLEIMFWLIHKQ